MVEAGLGVSIVPLMANGAVTRNRRVEVREIKEAIRPIHSRSAPARRNTIGARGSAAGLHAVAVPVG